MGKNPFNYTKPIEPSKFYGYEDKLCLIKQRILENENNIIIGGPSTGKTSILNYLSSSSFYRDNLAHYREKWLFVKIDSEEVINELKRVSHRLRGVHGLPCP